LRRAFAVLSALSGFLTPRRRERAKNGEKWAKFGGETGEKQRWLSGVGGSGDWMDAIGPPAALGGGPSACAFKTQAAAMKSCRHCGSDSGQFGCGPRNGSGSGPWKLFCPFAGIWWPRIFAARAQESARFFAKYRSLGGELDELVQDTELGEASWLTAHLIPSPAAGFRDPAGCLHERFRLIEEDSRFASDLATLVKRGFLPGNTSEPGWLQRSIGTVVPTNRTLNQIVFDQFVGERWSQGWSQAYFEPARQVFPAVQMSNVSAALFLWLFSSQKSKSDELLRTVWLLQRERGPGDRQSGSSVLRR